MSRHLTRGPVHSHYWGIKVTDGWWVILVQYHRFFSVLFVRGQAACLTTRLGHLGDGDRDNAGRRRGRVGRLRHSSWFTQWGGGGVSEARDVILLCISIQSVLCLPGATISALSVPFRVPWWYKHLQWPQWASLETYSGWGGFHSSLLRRETTLRKTPNFQWIYGKLNQIYEKLRSHSFEVPQTQPNPRTYWICSIWTNGPSLSTKKM